MCCAYVHARACVFLYVVCYGVRALSSVYTNVVSIDFTVF